MAPNESGAARKNTGLSAPEYIDYMWASRGSSWGPPALPDFLTSQLSARGFSIEDSGRIARQINEQSGTAQVAPLFVDLGSCKFLEGDIDGAIASWRHAISSESDTAAARALLHLGLLYEHLHLHERALGLLAAVADRNVEPYVVPAAMASARCQVAIGDCERAMETMARLAQRTMATNPDAPELIETLYGLGDVADRAGRPDRADRSWRVASASPPSAMQQAATERLLQLYVDQGQDDQVRDLIKGQADGAATVTSSADVLDRADALCRLGDASEAAALAATVESKELRPSDRFRLAALKAQTGNVNQAIDELESLLRHDDLRVQSRAACTLGDVYNTYDMFDAAMSMYERVVAAEDRYWSAMASLAIGDLLDASADSDAAIASWQRAATSEITVIAERALTRIAESSTTVPLATASLESAGTELDVVDLREPAASTVAPQSVPAAASATVSPHVISLDSIDDDFTIDAHPVVQPIAVEPTAVLPTEVEPTAVLPPDVAPTVVVLSALEGDLDATGVAANGHGPKPSAPEDGGPKPSGAADGGAAERGPEDSTADGGAEDDGDEQASNRVGTKSKAGDTRRVSRPASAFASHVEDTTAINPYAALAPDDEVADLPSTQRNPYAELAPNFDDPEPPPDVEPGDWESMLDEWPRKSESDESSSGDAAKQRSSAFSRYT